MAAKLKRRVEPDLEVDLLTDNFHSQMETGRVQDASFSGVLPSLGCMRGESRSIDRCLLSGVSLSSTDARRMRLSDVRVMESDLANVDLAGGRLERVEMIATRLTGLGGVETQFRSVLFRECKMDFALMRMARFERCVFEKCSLVDADFYEADLTGAVFRGCDLSRVDLSHARMAGADIRDCRLDGLRGRPAMMDELIIDPDQAALLIGLFGVKVKW